MREGYVEQVTKSWEEGGREYQGYIVLVRVSGDDTYEVGLARLRKKLGWNKITPDKATLLNNIKPDVITFDGKYHESGYGPHNTLQISEESAEQWTGMLTTADDE